MLYSPQTKLSPQIIRRLLLLISALSLFLFDGNGCDMERTQRNKSVCPVYGVCLEWQMYNTAMSCTNCLKEQFIRRVKARRFNQSNGVKVRRRYPSATGIVLRLQRIHRLACSHNKNLIVGGSFIFFWYQ